MTTAFTAWGDTKPKVLTFNNIIIDTLGNQEYDTDTNVITSTSHTRVTIDDTVIETDSLTYSVNQHLITAVGNVRVFKSYITLTADRLSLNTGTGWLEASGAVQFVSPAENYSSESIRYNINQMTGTMGALKGVVKGSKKDFYLTGESARMEAGTTVIQNAELTRSTIQNHPDYSFAARRLVVSGNNIHMEQVFFKFFGGKAGYLPRLVLQGEAVPRIDLSANQGDEIDLSQLVDETSKAAEPVSHTNRVEVNPRFQVAVNPFDKPSMITVGRIYTLNRYTEEVDLNFDTRGIFSFSNIFQIDWPKYNLTIDGRTDLVERPQQEFGVAFTKKAWKTKVGNWQVALLSRWLGYEEEGETFQGIYGGYRLDYQLNQDLNLSYYYLNDLGGTQRDWEYLEKDFLTINNYKLGGNLTYSLTIPLSPHYVIYSRGYYSLQYDSWTSQKVLFSREVGSIKMGCGWDFAKEFVELQFRMSI